jgi:hypothetical protein
MWIKMNRSVIVKFSEESHMMGAIEDLFSHIFSLYIRNASRGITDTSSKEYINILRVEALYKIAT